MSPAGSTQRRDTPTLVEITGVAGSGKSTLTSALQGIDESYQRAEFIHTRNPRHLLYLLGSLPRLLPILVPGLVRRPRMRWADVKLMAYVTAWSKFLARRPEYSSGIVLLDQGPVYSLVRLEAKALGVTTSDVFRRWWREMLAVWATELSLIVWLDAADDLLRSRINQRPQSHVIKDDTVDTGRQFITHYRSVFQQALDDIEQSGTAEVLRFQTDDTPADRIAGEVSKHLAERA